MNADDVIYEQGIYKIQFVKIMPLLGSVYVNNEKHSTTGHKGFQFCLLKNNEPFKWYSVATGFPYNYESIKSSVIQVLKNFIL